MTVEKFVRIVTTVFEKIELKNSKLTFPWSILAIFLKSQSYIFDVIAHTGPPYSVKKAVEFFVRNVRSFRDDFNMVQTDCRKFRSMRVDCF